MPVMKPTAVVADTDPVARDVVAGLVARLGFDVVAVRTGGEALEIAERETPAIVVLEVALEDGSAYECCRTLRERCGEGLLIVLIAGHRVDPADEVAGLLLGADEYVG